MTSPLNHLVLRTAVVLAGAIWLGGLVFYAGAVIPSAHDALGNHRQAGFITQRVTEKINIVAVISLVIFGVALAFAWRGASVGLRISLLISWMLLAIGQGILFFLHPVLDGMLDASTQSIHDHRRFYGLHRAYIIVSTMQMFIGGVFLVALLACWRHADKVRD
jgi:hypothetical protein